MLHVGAMQAATAELACAHPLAAMQSHHHHHHGPRFVRPVEPVVATMEAALTMVSVLSSDSPEGWNSPVQVPLSLGLTLPLLSCTDALPGAAGGWPLGKEAGSATSATAGKLLAA